MKPESLLNRIRRMAIVFNITTPITADMLNGFVQQTYDALAHLKSRKLLTKKRFEVILSGIFGCNVSHYATAISSLSNDRLLNDEVENLLINFGPLDRGVNQFGALDGHHNGRTIEIASTRLRENVYTPETIVFCLGDYGSCVKLLTKNKIYDDEIKKMLIEAWKTFISKKGTHATDHPSIEMLDIFIEMDKRGYFNKDNVKAFLSHKNPFLIVKSLFYSDEVLAQHFSKMLTIQNLEAFVADVINATRFDYSGFKSHYIRCSNDNLTKLVDSYVEQDKQKRITALNTFGVLAADIKTEEKALYSSTQPKDTDVVYVSTTIQKP